MPTKLHDQFCRCRTCKPPGPADFNLHWSHKLALFAVGALIAAYAIAWSAV